MSGDPYRPPLHPSTPPPGYRPQQPGSGMAIASLVLGIVSLPGICCWPVGGLLGVLAIIFGIIALNNVRAGTGGGQGMAMAGLICGGIAILLIIGVLVFSVAMQGVQGMRPGIR